MLRLSTVEVMYHDVILVLKGVSLEVPEGKIVALLGANGAGKTTTLKAISGLLSTEEGKVTDGSIDFDGGGIANSSPERAVKLGISQVLEGRRQFQHLTVEENLRAGGYVTKSGDTVRRDIGMVYDYFPRLKDLRDRTSGYLSGGEQQMLVIGSALMAHPKILLLDEPSLGLSPIMTQEIFDILGRINREEKTALLLVEQNARAALDLAEYGYVLENGRIVLDGTASDLKNNEDVKEFYLGLSEVGTKKGYRGVKHYRRRKRWLG
jgi:branched-chain amino acid transport system ATP-binding protein